MKNQYLLSIPEAAKQLGIGREKLRELCYADDTVPSVKVGPYTKINMPLMKEYLDKAAREGRHL
ncbi:hypothetical protein HZF24_11890 [Sedimentibacter hydroxybenzoicus DSM 7310]|uniref:DNA binding domain-containing protein, excisionase family n=1 Tax=Sedimentibacter hydroxybenzoicus DSM 7310 TaxID=1123245 RepID=A0A974BKH3_SEDHY|nr:hypothetical protein [Sedimentibacter hydroxybenzoicus]NYB74839.1 hypothetical protein [Sedimentibacter hydroxybenzoicus DSM 7310]